MDATLKKRALAAAKANRHTECAALAHAFLERNPTDRGMLAVLAEACAHSGHVAEGEKLYRFLLSESRSPLTLAGVALCAGARGAMEEAEGLLREALKLDPTFGRAWILLAEQHRFTANDPLIALAERVLKRRKIPAKTRRDVNFALCKAMGDLGRHDAAWSAAEAGKAADPSTFDPSAYDQTRAALRAVFDRPFLAPRLGRGLPTRAPIFVCGMPRSGTTLIERILNAHPKVIGVGELTYISQMCTDRALAAAKSRLPHPTHSWVRTWPAEAVTASAASYLEAVGRHAGGTPEAFVDKLPGNIMFLGQIAMMFPNARIVRMHRDPRDTCVSCFLGRFGAGHVYTQRLDWLAAAWRFFQDCGDILTPLIPNPVLDVSYETLVTEPEREIRRLLTFLDLPLDANCLTPERSGFATMTRSRNQVRQPIHAGSVGRWRHYERHLGPLLDALGLARDSAA